MTQATTAAIVRHVQQRLRELANPAKAGPMQAYMKTDMPFYGVQKPQRTTVLREMKRQFGIDSANQYRAVIEALWALPHREEKYLAIQLAVQWREQYNRPALLPLWKRMIKQGAWWDFVDDLAIRLVGPLLLEHRDHISPVMDEWVNDRNMWVRRSALIAPILHKKDTDQEQLFDHCRHRMHETEFFIRKAIGWTLREYAKTNPTAVKRFTLNHRNELSGLSFREATKNLDG